MMFEIIPHLLLMLFINYLTFKCDFLIITMLWTIFLEIRNCFCEYFITEVINEA